MTNTPDTNQRFVNTSENDVQETAQSAHEDAVDELIELFSRDWCLYPSKRRPLKNRVLVCGGRTYSDKNRVDRTLTRFHEAQPINLVIQGGARGADALARSWAAANGVQCAEYLADWEKHGRSAGPIRNSKMLKEGNPDYVVAFAGGAGTRNMIKQAQKAKIHVWMVE